MSNEGENEVNRNRVERYRLLLRARKVTSNHGVTGCLLHPCNVSEPITVAYSDIHKRSNIRNVQTCKSVWACPVCADRVTKFRAAELMGGLERWSKEGNVVALATYTISHKSWESCSEVLQNLMKTYNRFKAGTSYQKMKKSHQVAGSVRALEVLYGSNGWHWHIHEIYVLRGKNPDRFKPMLLDMRQRWLDMARKTGNFAVPKGFDLKREKQAAFDYIVKFGKGGQKETWGIAREVVRAPAKGRRTVESGKHPFALLENAEDRKADAVFWNEYVQATKRKLQLRYSVGLKALLGIGEVSDDEIIDAETEAEDRIMLYIPLRGWYLLNLRGSAVLSEFYMIADTGDAELLSAWLDDQDIDVIQPVT